METSTTTVRNRVIDLLADGKARSEWAIWFELKNVKRSAVADALNELQEDAKVIAQKVYQYVPGE